MTLEEVRKLINKISVGYREVYFTLNASPEQGVIWMQLCYYERDSEHPTYQAETLQQSRKWPIFDDMTESDIIKTVFQCLAVSDEHRRREWFKVDGIAIFSPHHSVDLLKGLHTA